MNINKYAIVCCHAVKSLCIKIETVEYFKEEKKLYIGEFY